ncbi:MAG: D-glycerate dehydrogenase, partial [Planctomycetota bacterium]
MKKVYVTRKLPEKALKMLDGKVEWSVNPEDRVLTKEELIQNGKDCDGILCLLTDPIDQEIMEKCPKVKIFSNYAVGYNNIDVEEATRRGIMVTNTPGVLTETTADFAFALLMAIARRIVEADHFLRAGKFKGWAPMLFLGQDVHNRTLGILGMGRIGQAVARKGRFGFNMNILYYDAHRNEKVEKELDANFCSPEELFAQSDFVSIHLPLTKETHHFVNADLLGRMKETACLINTARGPIVDEEALVKVLKEKKIFGAALDVFEKEPEVHPGLLDLENVILVPHLASASVETRTKMAVMAVENLLAGLEGKRPPCIVNPEVLE